MDAQSERIPSGPLLAAQNAADYGPSPSTSSGNGAVSASGSLSSLQGLVQDIGDQRLDGPPGTRFVDLQDIVQDPDQRLRPVNPFQVDTTLIQAVPASQQAAELQQLGLQVFNQDEFEEGIMAQVDTALAAEEKERMEKILRKELKTVEDDIRPCKQELQNIEKVIQLLKPQAAVNKEVGRRLVCVKQKKEVKAKQLKKLKAKQKSLALKLNCNLDGFDDGDAADNNDEASLLEQALLGLGPGSIETETERMIRMGEMTPFGTTVAVPAPQSKPVITDFEQYLMDQDSKQLHKKKMLKKVPSSASKPSDCDSDKDGANKSGKSKKRRKDRKSLSDSSLGSHIHKDSFEAKSQKVNFKKGPESNFFDSKDPKHYTTESDYSKSSARKRKLYYPKLKHNFSEDGALSDVEIGDEMDEEPWGEEDQPYLPPSDEDEQYSSDHASSPKKKGRQTSNTKKDRHSPKDKQPFTRAKDDGNADAYQRRLKEWHMAELKRKQKKMETGEPDTDNDSDMEFDGGFRVPAKIWNKLYRYQKTGVKWMWELHCQQAGGILGDEMGLGKTIQIIAFLTGLRHSKLRDRAGATRYNGLGPSIIVCPATVLHQWVREFHTWWPAFRVGVLHSSGSHTGSQQAMVHNIFRATGILVMPYSSVVIYQDLLLQYDWHYVVLDEGHKIRNPDAQCTIACKQFRTSHRLILSGSPVQNNLKELWSLFDFVFPGKLGTLPDFMAHFSVPIVQGGYSNATQVQVETAYKCACVLRDTINPYVLRRMKADVKNSLSLPSKSEQVLFCRLTEHQREVYQEYLDSIECRQILSGSYMVFPGLVTLRKVCNHPDLSTGGPRVFNTSCVAEDKTLEYGYWQRSGKLIVVDSLLSLWKKQGHRVLLFTQSRQMLDIFVDFMQKHSYTYLRMDGGTPIASRQPLIAKYNNDPSIYVFLLTTRVGGLGVNLTGADRVVIFDPDWNPSTDTQARERAWRIGQTKPVTVYRLLTTGTIEEKIYHRQIFKQFLCNRVLKDPKQRRFFKSNDLYELFTLGDDNPCDGTETSAIFAGTGSDIKVKVKAKAKMRPKDRGNKVNRFDRLKEIAEREKNNVQMEESDDEMVATSSTGDSPTKTAKMRELAQLLSKRLMEKSKSEDVPRIADKDPEVNGSTHTDNKDSPGTEGRKTGESSQDVSTKDTADKIQVGDAPATETYKKRRKKRRKKKKKKQKDAGTEGQKTGESSKDVSTKDTADETQKRRKKKKRKDAVFEGEKIAYLDKHSSYRPEQPEEEDNNTQKGDDYVLRKLFQKTGVHSALQHDKIMMSSNPDYALVEGEAQMVAAEAAKSLKQSRARCLGVAPGVPTWTGNSGQAGAPKPRFGQKKNSVLASKTPMVVEDKKKEPASKPKVNDTQPTTSHFDGTFAGNVRTNPMPRKGSHDLMSSGELLARMKARNHMTTQPANQGEDSMAVTTNSDPQHMELITDIRNFIAFGSRVDGQASTQELLDQFGKQIPTDSSVQFKAMLQQLCDFYKKDGVGVWKLKGPFR